MAKKKKDEKKQAALAAGTPESSTVEKRVLHPYEEAQGFTQADIDEIEKKKLAGIKAVAGKYPTAGLQRPAEPSKKTKRARGIAEAAETPGKAGKSAEEVLKIIRPGGLTKAEQRAIDTGAAQLGQPKSKSPVKIARKKGEKYIAPEGGGRIKIKGKWVEYTKDDLAGIVKEAKAKGKLVSGKDVVGERVVDGKKVPITAYDVSEAKRRVGAGLPGREAALRGRQAEIRVKEGMEFNKATGEYQPVGGQVGRRERFAEAQRRVNGMTGKGRAAAQKRLNALSKRWDKEDAQAALRTRPIKAPKTQKIKRADGTTGLFQFSAQTGKYEDTGLNAPTKAGKVGEKTAAARTKALTTFIKESEGDEEFVRKQMEIYDRYSGGAGAPAAPAALDPVTYRKEAKAKGFTEEQITAFLASKGL